MPYIKPEGKYHLQNFKYAGGTDSLTYKYLWSPMDEFLLRFVPESIAPNVITLFALLILLVTHIIFMLPDQNGIPDWKLYMMGVALIVYQHLDNIDGKQARKTNSSSPLGMLFDHGADSVSGFLVAAQVMKILDISFEMQLFCIYIFIMNTYFCAMWSQYCVGYFRLGRVNPIDEGIPSYAIGCFIATQIDLSGVSKFHIYGTYAEEIIYIMLILLVPVMISLSKDIFKKPIKPMSQVLFMPLLYISAGLCCWLFSYTEGPLTASTFYPFFYFLLLFWSRNMILIQFQFIVKQNYKVFNIATNILIASVVIFFFAKKYIPFSTSHYFLAWAMILGLIFMEFVVAIFNEGAKMLNIKIFTLGPRDKKQ